MKKLITVILFFGLLQACIEDFRIKFPVKENILIVEGILTDQPGEQFVSLKATQNRLDSAKFFAVLNANVEILVDDKERILLIDKFKNGEYYLPINFKVKTNTSYKLKITTLDGKKYESTNEMLTASPQMENVRIVFEAQGILKGIVKEPAHFIYIDTQDPKGINNNYFWTWQVWEKQPFCISCSSGGPYRYNTRTRRWECVVGLSLLYYDYPCDVACWDKFSSPELNVIGDKFLDGNQIKDRLVAKVPYRQIDGALVEIKQQCVSEAGYRYLRLLIEQGQNTGTLADTPPAALVGNIKNIDNPKESVAGVFLVSGTDKKLIWLDRKDVPEGSSRPLGILGREPGTTDAGNPILPIITCINSNTRTKIKPIGWRD
jgi:hypothetical protein